MKTNELIQAVESIRKLDYGCAHQIKLADEIYPRIVEMQDELSDEDWKKIHLNDCFTLARRRWMFNR